VEYVEKIGEKRQQWESITKADEYNSSERFAATLKQLYCIPPLIKYKGYHSDLEKI
jgi:hypothetical protein